MSVPPYRCEGCGLAWTPSRADGARNGQRCPRCGGLLVRDDAVEVHPMAIPGKIAVDQVMGQEIARLSAKLDAAMEIVRAVATMPPRRSNYQWGRYGQCAFLCSDAVPIGSCPVLFEEIERMIAHAPECPVTRARALLANDTAAGSP